MNYKIDFVKEYDFKEHGCKTLYVVHEEGTLVCVYTITRRPYDGKYFYTRDECWLDNFSKGTWTDEKLTIDQLVTEDFSEEYFWQHP